MSSKTLRLLVHRLADGSVAASVIHRSQAGRETWDRRALPPRSLGTPPAPPAGIRGDVWYLLCVVTRLLGAEWVVEISRAAGPEPRGAVGGESAEWPIVRNMIDG